MQQLQEYKYLDQFQRLTFSSLLLQQLFSASTKPKSCVDGHFIKALLLYPIMRTPIHFFDRILVTTMTFDHDIIWSSFFGIAVIVVRLDLEIFASIGGPTVREVEAENYPSGLRTPLGPIGP